jgi:hypothetical protein
VKDFRMVLRTVTVMFFGCLCCAVSLATLDAFHHLALADFLVRKLSDIMILCVGAIAGLLTGKHLATRAGPNTRRIGKQ